MSDELELRGGGAIAVDTATVRAAAARFDATCAELERALDRFGPLQNQLAAQRAHAWPAVSAAAVLHGKVREVIAAAEVIADRLRSVAGIYELVELNAQHRAALLAGDDAALKRIDAARQRIMAEDDTAMAAAVGLEVEHGAMWPRHLVRQSTEVGRDLGSAFGLWGGPVGGVAAGGFVLGSAALLAAGGAGRVSRESRLQGPAPPVLLQPVPVAPVTAPAGLAAAAGRVPQGGASQIRVEKYTMGDGSRQFAVYVAGTRTLGAGGREPWDMASNQQLYRGERSASYQATVAALRDAGAEPGDVVHAFGHSQGAMIASHLALEGEFDARTVVSYGSPISADVPESTLSVALRHTDDPVGALAGGGHPGGVGAPGSFIAEREAHPASGVSDFSLPGHTLAGYADTAALVDDSSDPRVSAVRGVFDTLGQAVEVEAMEYAASRDEVSPSSSGAG
ncbi:hypothetical protein [Microbacterium aureliae]